MNSLPVAAASKIVVIFLLIYFAESDAGCKLYGHSCWGGHGKRSSSSRHFYGSFSPEQGMNEWYFSKFIKLSGGKSDYSSTFRIQDLNDFNKYDEFRYEKNFAIGFNNDDINSNHHFPTVHRTIKKGGIKENDKSEPKPFEEILYYN